MENFNTTVKNWLSIIDTNEYVSTGLILFLILYAGMAAPKLSPQFAALFDNPVVKFVILFFIAYMANRNPAISVIIAIGLMVSLYTLSNYKMNMKLKDLVYRTEMAFQRQAVMQRQNNMQAKNESQGVSVSAENLNELQNGKMDPVSTCSKVGKYRNSFYPQYVNMKPDAYMARDTGNAVAGYDTSADYATL